MKRPSFISKILSQSQTVDISWHEFPSNTQSWCPTNHRNAIAARSGDNLAPWRRGTENAYEIRLHMPAKLHGVKCQETRNFQANCNSATFYTVFCYFCRQRL